MRDGGKNLGRRGEKAWFRKEGQCLVPTKSKT